MRAVVIWSLLGGCSLCCAGGEMVQHERDPLWVVTARLPDRLEFCGEPVPLERPDVREGIERELYILLQQPGQLVLYQKRAGRYMALFEGALRDSNLPLDLRYVAIAESALLPMAQSPKQAVGLWQFIPETARQMGLRVDNYVDERRHPERSTRAALRYLRQGYQLFGSWTAAVAGYNMGHQQLQAQLQEQGARSFYDAFLTEETTRYIYRIVALKHVLENSARYGVAVPLEERYGELPVRIVRWTEGIADLVAWAQQQGVRYKEVRLLNPWILQRQLPPPRPGEAYEIALPQ